jgi:hypothetical protein
LDSLTLIGAVIPRQSFAAPRAKPVIAIGRRIADRPPFATHPAAKVNQPFNRLIKQILIQRFDIGFRDPNAMGISGGIQKRNFHLIVAVAHERYWSTNRRANGCLVLVWQSSEQ